MSTVSVPGMWEAENKMASTEYYKLWSSSRNWRRARAANSERNSTLSLRSVLHFYISSIFPCASTTTLSVKTVPVTGSVHESVNSLLAVIG